MKLFLLALITFISQAAPARAASINIVCPQNVRVEATSGVTAPWTATPQVQNVFTTRLMDLGGRQTLACVYRFYGGEYIVWRDRDPVYPNCQAVEGGFYCTP
ncbi:MAG TPA: hypothetical protein PLA85_06585 [Micropepsaceae bacterium]|nr:hypothetical protein [Micropepsaceae bacterium]HRK71234.1 hypothetical protein [Micropepsaceae bacterium]